MNGTAVRFDGSVVSPPEAVDTNQIIEFAKMYLGAPYLWGGRSPLGIDCSGFVQIVFKMAGLILPRDASQQVSHGEAVNFIHEARKGDLAFFGNDEGNIVHVGILIDNSHIIHASGRVRIDMIDHQGIFNDEEKQYTHRLRVIKRLTGLRE